MRNSLKIMGLLTLLASSVVVGCGDSDSSSTGSSGGSPGFSGGGGAAGSGVAGTTGIAGSSSGGKGGTGGKAGSGGSGGSGGSAGGSAGNTAGGAAGSGTNDCSSFFDQPNDCGTCLQDKCCDALTACGDDEVCSACLQGATDPECNNNDALKGVDACLQGSCSTECAAPPDCNPVTNEGCDTAAGEACDFGQDGFQCYGPPNDTALCGACDNQNGPFCLPGNSCLGGQCAKFCCDDADCGTGKCDTSLSSDGTGLCVTELGQGQNAKPACDAPSTSPSGGSCFGSGSGGSGGSGSTAAPSCDAPADPPSKGACVADLVGKDAAFPCNPITNEGCNTAAGEACDFGQNGFQCYPDGNTQALCDTCDATNGPYCKGGLTCAGTQCAKFCCDDSDCGTGTCDKSAVGDSSPLGVCFEGSGAGGAGGSGAGGSDAGSGGSDAGSGGSDAGAGGSDAGSGGSDAGAGGSDAGSGGSDAAGSGGTDAAGSGGSAAGGSSAGSSSGGSAGTGGSSSGGSSSGGSAGAGGAGASISPGCLDCIGTKCDTQFGACASDPACAACATGDPTAPGCSTNSAFLAAVACACAPAACNSGNACKTECTLFGN